MCVDLVSMMAQQQRAVVVSLRNMAPIIPECKQERAQLEEDLKKMRCVGLLKRPWALKDEGIVRELLLSEPSNCFDNTI